MHPAGEVSGALRDDRVGRQVVAQPDHDLAEIDRARHRGRLLAPGEIVGMRSIAFAAPGNVLGRLQLFQRNAKCRRRCVNRKMRVVDAAQFFRTRMHMHELDLRFGDIEHAVAL